MVSLRRFGPLPLFSLSLVKAARLREGSHADTLKASKAWRPQRVATPLGFEPRITPPKGGAHVLALCVTPGQLDDCVTLALQQQGQQSALRKRKGRG